MTIIDISLYSFLSVSRLNGFMVIYFSVYDEFSFDEWIFLKSYIETHMNGFNDIFFQPVNNISNYTILMSNWVNWCRSFLKPTNIIFPFLFFARYKFQFPGNGLKKGIKNLNFKKIKRKKNIIDFLELI